MTEQTSRGYYRIKVKRMTMSKEEQEIYLDRTYWPKVCYTFLTNDCTGPISLETLIEHCSTKHGAQFDIYRRIQHDIEDSPYIGKTVSGAYYFLEPHPSGIEQLDIIQNKVGGISPN